MMNPVIDELADTLLQNKMVQFVFESANTVKYDMSKIDVDRKSLSDEIDYIFRKMSPESLVQIMSVCLDNLEFYSQRRLADLKNVYNIKKRISRLQPTYKVTIEDFYKHCLQTYCANDIPFEHPNGWIMYINPHDYIDYANPYSYNICTHENDINYSGKGILVQFKLINYPDDYFNGPDGKFWKMTGLKYVDLDNCHLYMLEPLFEWFNQNNIV